MTERRSLTLACGDYDRTRALADGRVRPEGLDVTYLRLGPEEIFFRQLVHKEFSVSEMSLGSYTMSRSRGDGAFIALPVFPSRSFRHSGVFVHADSGINRPEDLRGKRVGVPEYQLTALTWIRGIFQEWHGVHPREMCWYTGGLEQSGRREKVGLSLPGMCIESIPEGATLSQMLEKGELDAVFSARIPGPFLRESPKVRRMFADYRSVEADYFAKTQIFPIMHLVVIRCDVYERDRWIAQNLTKAFDEAKRLAAAAIYDTTALPTMVPWMHTEIEATRRLMGSDWWPYGLEPNRKALETFLRYSHEQGLLERSLSTEELFAAETLDTFRV